MAGDSGTCCRDCGAETLSLDPGVPCEWYVVHEEVWEQAQAAGPDPCGILCIGCLEARLGRQLRPADFTPADINDPVISNTVRYAWSWRSARLRDRLGDTAAFALEWLDEMPAGVREDVVAAYSFGRHRQRLADRDALTRP